jgi:hypothetical protein
MVTVFGTVGGAGRPQSFGNEILELVKLGERLIARYMQSRPLIQPAVEMDVRDCGRTGVTNRSDGHTRRW